MKVVGEAPTGRSRRLIVTEHGIPYQARASWERSAHSSRRSHDLEGEDEKVVERRKGAQAVDRQLSCGTRDAESQSDTDYHLSPLATG